MRTDPCDRSSSSARNIVGTPYRAVGLSCSTECRTALASNASDGSTTQAPAMSGPGSSSVFGAYHRTLQRVNQAQARSSGRVVADSR